jgi:hypothetical protein
MTKMDPQLKRKWLIALRSGRYKQGRDQLKRGRKFCCLGVLADVAGCRWEKTRNCSLPRPSLYGYTLSSLGLLLDMNNHWVSEQAQNKLSSMNDGSPAYDDYNKKPQSFKQIAKWIQEHL